MFKTVYNCRAIPLVKDLWMQMEQAKLQQNRAEYNVCTGRQHIQPPSNKGRENTLSDLLG